MAATDVPAAALGVTDPRPVDARRTGWPTPFRTSPTAPPSRRCSRRCPPSARSVVPRAEPRGVRADRSARRCSGVAAGARSTLGLGGPTLTAPPGGAAWPEHRSATLGSPLLALRRRRARSRTSSPGSPPAPAPGAARAALCAARGRGRRPAGHPRAGERHPAGARGRRGGRRRAPGAASAGGGWAARRLPRHAVRRWIEDGAAAALARAGLPPGPHGAPSRPGCARFTCGGRGLTRQPCRPGRPAGATMAA